MADRFTPDQHNIIDRSNRPMEEEGIPMSDVLEEIFEQLDAGEIGIEANAYDVDSICKDGGSFAWDKTNSKGLNFFYFSGRFHNGAAIVDVGASDITLTDNATNYIEVNSAGVVSVTTGGFTAGRLPLFQVVTASGLISTVTQKKPILSMVMPDMIAGSKMTAAASLKTAQAYPGTISATTSVKILVPQPYAAALSGLRVVVDTTITPSDTDYWTVSAVNKGAAGSGTTDMLASSDANTTKATGGAALTANVARAFTLHGTAANLDVTGAHVIIVTFTKTASAANLVNPLIQLEFANDA